MLLGDLINVIETLKERMTTHFQSLQQNETRTRTTLIDPLLTALGWDVSDPGLVTPEYSVGQGKADYALVNGGPQPRPVAIVEAKPLGSLLNDRERNQMLTYVNMEGIKYAVLTNGDLWELYDIFKPARLDERRLLNVRITSTPTHQLALQLLLLWRTNLASGVPVPAQEPVLGTRRETATTEVFHPTSPPVDTPLARTSSVPPSAMPHQPQQQRRSSGSRQSRYCVDGETWIECPDATLLMISIVEWCAQQHVRGVDDYYRTLSSAHFNSRKILIKERVTRMENKYYCGRKVNEYYIFRNCSNQQKKKIIGKILSSCTKQSGTHPVLDEDVQVDMPNG